MDSISSHVEISAEAKTFNWLLGSFATRHGGCAGGDRGLLGRSAHGQVVEARNGPTPTAWPPWSPAWPAWRRAPSDWYRLGALNRVVVDMGDGYLVVTSISRGSALGVIASKVGEPRHRGVRDDAVRHPRGRFPDAGVDRGTEKRRPVLNGDGRGTPDPEPIGRIPPYLRAHPSGAAPAGPRAAMRPTIAPHRSAPVRPDLRPGQRRRPRRSTSRPR